MAIEFKVVLENEIIEIFAPPGQRKPGVLHHTGVSTSRIFADYLNLKAPAFLVLLFLDWHAAFAQEGNFGAGFRIISTYDSSRIYKVDSEITHALHYRPISVDIWYPAKIDSPAVPVSFGSLVHLLEQRSNFYDDTRSYEGLADEMIQYFCTFLDGGDFTALKQLRTNSFFNALAADKRFPLVIYLAGFNGMSYENYALFERLAENGFVVASVSSVGRFPGNMTMEPEDLMEQVKDAEFVLALLSKNIPGNGKIGLLGYSWGGLAAAVLAMSDSRIDALVSLDGSEQFAYADPDENMHIERIKKAGFFNPGAIRSPYLYLDSDITNWDTQPDSVDNIIDRVSGEKCYLKLIGASHEDFSSLSVLTKEDKQKSIYSSINALALSFLRDKLRNEMNFYDELPAEGISRVFGRPKPEKASLDEGKITIQGVIRDHTSNEPLPYVNVGVIDKDIGTTSNSKGEFQLVVTHAHEKDSLKFSMVGFDPMIISVRNVLNFYNGVLNVSLQERTGVLEEVVVTEKRFRTKVLGNKSESRFIGGKFASGDLGSEIAIRINVRNSPTYIDRFNFNISYNTNDTATFRVNVYEVVNGYPGRNILTENILLTINGQTGNVEVDLTDHNVIVSDDFFIGLEWVEGRSNSGIVFSSGFANKGTYYRKASQAKWKKYAMGVGFNIVARY